MRSLASSKTIDGFLLRQPPRPLFPSSCFPSNWWSGSCEILSASAKIPWNLKFTQTSPKQNAFIPVYTADTKMMRKERPALGPICLHPGSRGLHASWNADRWPWRILGRQPPVGGWISALDMQEGSQDVIHCVWPLRAQNLKTHLWCIN